MSGQIGWIDLTVPDAPALRDFYQGVTGWTPSPVEMGGYQDFCMHPSGEPQPVAASATPGATMWAFLRCGWSTSRLTISSRASAAARNCKANCSDPRPAWDQMGATA
jgi:hypothetical protein